MLRAAGPGQLQWINYFTSLKTSKTTRGMIRQTDGWTANFKWKLHLMSLKRAFFSLFGAPGINVGIWSSGHWVTQNVIKSRALIPTENFLGDYCLKQPNEHWPSLHFLLDIDWVSWIFYFPPNFVNAEIPLFHTKRKTFNRVKLAGIWNGSISGECNIRMIPEIEPKTGSAGS